MADEHASTSSGGARSTTTKRKMVSNTSESGDSVFSPPGKRYKLRATTTHGCVFSGNSLSENEMSRSGSSCNIRGPATSYWGSAQTNRLHFQKPIQVSFDSSWSRILKFLCQTRTVSGKKLTGPELLTTAMEEKIIEGCTGSPIAEYIEEMITYLSKKDFTWDDEASKRSKEQIQEIETHLEKKIFEDQESSNFQKQLWLSHVKECINEAMLLCSGTKRPERHLDEFVVFVMQLAQHQDQLRTKYFRISQTGKSKVTFEICGSLVTSMTNILWEAGYRGKMSTTCFPVLMCENKGSYSEGENEGKQTTKTRTATSVHMKLPQVIGQCISMADKSVFETKDYKIVYHVSLMSTTKLVITRTHVAKSTLKVIKDGCPIPDKNDLDPSYVFEAALYIHNDWEDLIRHLYKTLQIFQKLGYFIVCEKPESEKC